MLPTTDKLDLHPRNRGSQSDPALDLEQLDISSVRQKLISQFHVAFALMSIIPLLICCYLITVRFFSLSILVGLNSVVFLSAIIVALIGLLAGRLMIKSVIMRLVKANSRLINFHVMQAAFVSHVAHEFRSPLAIIKGSLDNLNDGLHGPLSEDQKEPVDMCNREVERLKRLISDLLDVSQIEAGKLRLEKTELVLQEILKHVAQSVSGLVKKRGLELNVKLASTPAVCYGDKDRLSQVFLNLISNAIKFTEKGSITVSLTQNESNYDVEITDTGRGIEEKDLSRIFRKFERVGDKSQDGYGLGLSIVKAIVENHNGSIGAESQLGQGSRFLVTLPMYHTALAIEKAQNSSHASGS